EPLAASTNFTLNVNDTIASLRDQGVSVFAYALTIQLIWPRRAAAGAFEFTLTGPPGIYTVLASANLTAWSELSAVTNNLGSAGFTDMEAGLSRQKFYSVRSTP